MQSTQHRRRFLANLGAVGLLLAGIGGGGGAAGRAAGATETATGGGERTLAATGEAGGRPDGRILAREYRWISPGSPRTGNRYALRLTDDGGVYPGFRVATAGDLTIDAHFRHHRGRKLAYFFNDQSSLKSGFRAFTNGRAGRGIYFRNVFGGRDFRYGGNVQDGEWHWLRIVLDAERRTFSAYLDGERIGRRSYHGRGWGSHSNFRVMGMRTGSGTLMDYDRFVMVDRAIYPEEAPFVVSHLLHYELEDGAGDVVANRPVARTDDLIEEKRSVIDEIRDAAGTLLTPARAEGLDGRAATLLDDLEAGGPGGPVVAETVERLVDAEQVTLAGTRGGVEPARRLADLVISLAKAAAAGRLAGRVLRTAGWAGRRLESIARDVVGRTRRLVTGLLARPVLAPRFRRRLDGVVDDLTVAMDDYLEDHGDDLAEVGEALVKESFDDVLGRLPDGARARLDRLHREARDGVAAALYRRLQFAPAAGPGTDAPGLDVSMDAAVGRLAELLGTGAGAGAGDGDLDLDLPSDGDPSTVVAEAVETIESGSETVLETMAAADRAAGGAGTLGLVVAILALVAYAVAAATAATGVGVVAGATAATIGAELQLYAGLLGGVAAVLLGGSAVLGVEFLRDTRRTHASAVTAILGPAAEVEAR